MTVLFWALNILTFASVWLIIVTVFRPPSGKGYEDAFRSPVDYAERSTVFDVEFMRPVLWPMLQFARWLNLPGLKLRLQRHLNALGNPNLYSPNEYMVICMLWAIAGALGAYLLYWAVADETTWAATVSGTIIGAGGAYFYLRERAIRRLRAISKRITYALDLISMTMDAGATFYEAATTVIKSNPEDPLNEELSIMIREIDFGRSRREALQHLAYRAPIDGLDSIISAIVQAEELGTPLADVLRMQSNMLRMHRSMLAERRAGAAAVKLLVPSTLILISVALIIFGPYIIRAIQGELY